MSALLSTQGPVDGDVFSSITNAIHHQGYIILNDVFPLAQLQIMFMDIKATDSEQFHEAGIGREQEHQLNQFVRRDRIFWLPENHQPALAYLQWTEQLRQRLNRDLFLGLFDYECHYAHYQKGGFYKKHYDSFMGSTNRRLTTILYLNPAWQPLDGGELLLYSNDNESLLETVMPCFGTMVVFLSEEFPHEVLTANRSRYSLTGWFRINNTDSLNLDPPG